MFPVVRASVSGLEAGQSYFVLLDIVLAEESRYKYQVGPHSVLNPPVSYNMTFATASQLHIYLLQVNACLECLVLVS